MVSCFDEDVEMVKVEAHENCVAEEEHAASTVNLKGYFWVTTEDFRRCTLQICARVIKKVNTKLEENGFNLPANITELKFYDASKTISVRSKRMKVNKTVKINFVVAGILMVL